MFQGVFLEVFATCSNKCSKKSLGLPALGCMIWGSNDIGKFTALYISLPDLIILKCLFTCRDYLTDYVKMSSNISNKTFNQLYLKPHSTQTD